VDDSKTPQKIDRSQLPGDFLTSSRFVNWRSETVDGRANCKVPYSPLTKQRASSTDPATQGTLDQAIAADPEHIGLVIGQPFVAVDIDKVVDLETGKVDQWALDLIAVLPPTYTERSPSARGFHLWFKGKQPKETPDGVRAPDLEVYFSKRYFTLTTDRVEGTPQDLGTLNEEQLRYLLSVVESRKAKNSPASEPITKPVLREDQVLALLMNGKIVEAGFSDPTGDSDADLRLCGILAKRFNGNRELIEQMWLGSGLKREKTLRADYRQRTIDEALKNFQAKTVAEPEIDPATWDQHFTLLSTWKIDPPVEIVEGIIVRDAITVLAGLFESYKSMFALEIMSAIRQNRLAFDHFKVFSQPNVLHLCLDMSPAGFYKYASFFGLHQNEGFRGIDPHSDAQIGIDDVRFKAAVKGRILVLDTMLDYANIAEAFQSKDWIVFFGKLRRLMTQHGCVAVVLIAHPTKSGARSASIDVTEYLKDSVTFGGKVDLAFAFKKIPDTSKIWIERVKQGRFYEKPIKFTISSHDEHGASNISRGRFPICETPEDLEGERIEDRAANKGGGRPDREREIKTKQLVTLRSENPKAGHEELSRLLKEKFSYPKKLSKNTVKKWLAEHDDLEIDLRAREVKREPNASFF
jgi:hypothetical protein